MHDRFGSDGLDELVEDLRIIRVVDLHDVRWLE